MPHDTSHPKPVRCTYPQTFDRLRPCRHDLAPSESVVVVVCLSTRTSIWASDEPESCARVVAWVRSISPLESRGTIHCAEKVQRLRAPIACAGPRRRDACSTRPAKSSCTLWRAQRRPAWYWGQLTTDDDLVRCDEVRLPRVGHGLHYHTWPSQSSLPCPACVLHTRMTTTIAQRLQSCQPAL
jgi:hypothetical protein